MDMQVKRKKAAARRTFSIAEKLENGRLAHEKVHGGIAATAIKLGIVDSLLRSHRSLYRQANGLSDEKDPRFVNQGRQGALGRAKRRPAIPGGMSAEERRARDVARKREKHAAMKAAQETQQEPQTTMPTNNQIVPVQTKQDVSQYIDRIAELEYELDRAHDEVLTLQKILMTVGRTL
jgi:hypothetical protein